jgi:hypothetical protein
MMFNLRVLPIALLVVALGLGACSVAQAVELGGEDYNDGSGNTAGLTYTDGTTTIGETGDNKAWAFGPINWIDVTDANSGSVFLSALVRRELEGVQWGGISFFTDDQSDEIMYFGAATGDEPNAREFFGTHDQESGLQTASEVLFDAGTIHLMVGELDIDGGKVRMWVDPPLNASSIPAPILEADFAMTEAGKAVGSVRLNAGASPFITGDEVLVGTQWSDVIVPEPSSLLLLVLGGLALACRRRR